MAQCHLRNIKAGKSPTTNKIKQIIRNFKNQMKLTNKIINNFIGIFNKPIIINH